MTLTKEILKEIHYVNHSGGIDEVSGSIIRKILEKYDPEGVESFDPWENLEN